MKPDVSVVIPCLNEVETLGICIEKIKKVAIDSQLEIEILVCDNGSTDGSIELALNNGVTLIHVKERGYGYALQAGFNAAKGRYAVMGDADDSYDFLEIPKYIEALRAGADVVIGCRLPTGGGVLKKGSMPLLHRWIGNPSFSFISKILFRVPFNDIYCGFRAFDSDKIKNLKIVSRGMEYAVEMMIKSVFNNLKISEVPITYYPDGRVIQKSHLRTFRDGFRTLRLLLIYSPDFIFKLPGFILIMMGIIFGAASSAGLKIYSITFDVHTFILAALSIIVGHQFLIFSSCADVFSITEGFKLRSKNIETRSQKTTDTVFSIILGFSLIVLGCAAVIYTFLLWRSNNYGPLNYPYTMRIVITAVLLLITGVQQVLYAFYRSMLEISKLSV